MCQNCFFRQKKCRKTRIFSLQKIQTRLQKISFRGGIMHTSNTSVSMINDHFCLIFFFMLKKLQKASSFFHHRQLGRYSRRHQTIGQHGITIQNVIYKASGQVPRFHKIFVKSHCSSSRVFKKFYECHQCHRANNFSGFPK